MSSDDADMKGDDDTTRLINAAKHDAYEHAAALVKDAKDCGLFGPSWTREINAAIDELKKLADDMLRHE